MSQWCLSSVLNSVFATTSIQAVSAQGPAQPLAGPHGSPMPQHAGCSPGQETRSSCLGGCRSTNPPAWCFPQYNPSEMLSQSPQSPAKLLSPPPSSAPGQQDAPKGASLSKKPLLLGKMFCSDKQTTPHLMCEGKT